MTRLSKPDDCSSGWSGFSVRLNWRTSSKNLVPSKPDSIWGPVMIQISKLKRVFLGFSCQMFPLWSGEMKCSPRCYIFDFKCGEPTPFDRWRLDVQVCWSEICQWVWVTHELSGRQSDSEKKFTSCMVVIFHSMWVVHLQLIPLLKTSSGLVRPHCLDSSDLFYLNLFSQVESELSMEARVRKGVVKKQVDFQPNRMWPQVSLGWKWALCSVSLSLSLFFLPPAK